MVASANRSRSRSSAPAWHNLFLTMLPRIIAYARVTFRNLGPEAKADALQEVAANAFVAFARLAELGKTSIAWPTPLAMYATRQYRVGRRVGNRMNVCDVSSEYARRMKGICLQRLDHFDDTEGVWQEILIPDRTCTPAELAATRIDFPAWLRTLSKRDRKIALKLAAGETTGRVARMFKVSAGRVSQLRRAFAESWQGFHGESATPAAVPA